MDSARPQPDEDALAVTVQSTAAVATVWRSLTADRADWWPGMRFDAVPGGLLREIWMENDVESHAWGQVREVQDGEVLTVDWRELGWPCPLSVRFALAPNANATFISLTECGFDGLPNGLVSHADHSDGWNYHLNRLRRQAER